MWENSYGCWPVPLQPLAGELPAEQGLSRPSAQNESSRMPLSAAKAATRVASSVLKTSLAESLTPSIGVTPCIAQSCSGVFSGQIRPSWVCSPFAAEMAVSPMSMSVAA